MPRRNAPTLTQRAMLAIAVAAIGAALTWLVQLPERGATLPQPPPPPATVPPAGTPSPGPAPVEPALTPATTPGNDPAAADPDLAAAEPAEPAPTPQPSPWRAIDTDAFSLTAVTIPLHAHLPGAYRWPLPAIDRLELICFHRPDGPSHLAVMQAADGRVYHWGEEFHFLRDHLDAGGIDSREIRTVADPGAFMQPLRAAAHAACESSLQDSDTPDGPE